MQAAAGIRTPQTAGQPPSGAQAGSPPRPEPPPSKLAGAAELPFVVRANLTFAKTDALLDYIAVVLTFLGFLRFRPFLFPGAYPWLATHLLIPLANIAWRRRCLRASPRDGGSWARWREVPAAIIRGTTMWRGVAWTLTGAALDALPLSPRGARASQLLIAPLNFINTTAVPILLMSWWKPLRLGWALPLQLAVTVIEFTPYAPAMCATAYIQGQTELRPLLHSAAWLLDSARLALHPMLPRRYASTKGVSSGSPADDCIAVMVFIQLAAGFAIPALVHAAQEARLFSQHQRERRALGLQAETGWHARVCCAVAAVPATGQRVAAALIWAALILLLWDAVMWLQAGRY